MTDIYRISFVKLLRALAEQARNDFADEVFDAESTGERPDLEPVVVEIAVEFAEDISDAIEALQARVLEHDRVVAEKDAEIERLVEALREISTMIPYAFPDYSHRVWKISSAVLVEIEKETGE